MDVLASVGGDGLDAVLSRSSTASSLDVADEAARGRDARSRDYVAEQLASGALKLAVTDPDDPANWPRVLNVWRANLLGSSSKGNEYFLRHLLGTTSNLQAQPTPEALRPNDIAWADGHPRGQARPADVDRLPDDVDDTAVGYRAARGDLVREGTTCRAPTCIPIVHAFSPAIDPPWETRSDFEAFGAIARAFSTLAATHLGIRTDVVLGTLQHDTPGAMAYPGGTEHDWRVTGETPVPGKTMGPIAVVERDYAADRRQMGDAGAAGGQPGRHHQGHHHPSRPRKSTNWPPSSG